MIETFTALLAAHCLADFTLQSEWMVKHKKHPLVLLLHISVVWTTTALTIGGTPVPLLIGLVAIHLVTDVFKTYFLKDSLFAFILDQAIHLLAIVALAFLYPDEFRGWWWAHLLDTTQLPYFFSGLVLLTGIIVNLHVGAILIRNATARFSAQVRSPIRGLENGGAYIGFLERGMVMLFILTNQAAGVGFLITAKSILRFGDVKNTNQRKSTEYIIIGTFMSFGWSLLVAILTQHAIEHWIK